MFVQGIMLTAFLLSCFATPVATAQGEWKWAHYWSGTDGINTSNVFNQIYKTDFDEYGNIYVYGSIGGMSTFDGDRLHYVNNVPVYSSDDRATFLVKLDTLGNVLWYKVLKSSEKGSCFPFWMEVKNDKVYISSNMSLDWVDDPWVNEVWLYYFDTLITGPQVHAIPMEQRRPPYKSGRYTCFATFDLDGNLIDNHFITTFTREIYVGGIRGEFGLCKPSTDNAPFHIDSEGNIFVYTFLSYNGLESDPYTIMIDGDTNNVYNVYLPGNTDVYHPSFCTGMIYKFSPNWELLFAKPMVDHTEGVATSWELSGDSVNPLYAVYITGMSFDEEDNMYVSGHVTLALHYGTGGELHQYPIHIYWDSTHYATINDISSADVMPFLIKYSPDGDVLWCNQIYTTGSANPGAQNLAAAYWLGCKYYGHYLYLIGHGAVAVDGVAYFDDISHPLQVFAPFNSSNSCNSGFFVKFNSETGRYVNQGIVPAMRAFPETFPDVISNRLFAYVNLNDLYRIISEWCTNGEYIKSDSISSSSYLEKCSIIVNENGYLLASFTTKSPVTFSDNVFVNCPTDHSSAVFALYHNPEFATPFVPDDSVGIEEYYQNREREIYFSPNPTDGKSYVYGYMYGYKNIELFDMQGRKLGVLFEARDFAMPYIDLSPYPTGTYIVKINFERGVSVVRKVVKN